MNALDHLVGKLRPLIGVEHDLHTVNYSLKLAVRGLGAPVIGAIQIRCSDEAEWESVEAFQTGFAKDLLPRLKFAHHAPMSTFNLGGQYEWGSLPVVEDHFATPASRTTFKLIVVTVNSHVGVRVDHGERHYGLLRRYDTDSLCCAMMARVLAEGAGGGGPNVDRLIELFGSEGVDRVAMLINDVEPRLRMLAAALVGARLQARNVVLEAQAHEPAGPTIYMVVPMVTLNRPDSDGEIVCGFYLVDRGAGRVRDSYIGLGDVPVEYEIVEQHGHLRVSDPGIASPREARDHRRLVLEAWRESESPGLGRDSRVDDILDRASAEALADHGLASILLKSLLLLLSELSPVSAAMLLFGEGAAGIYSAHRAHRLVQDVEASEEAREMLADIHRRVDRMPPEEIEKVLQVLLAQYQAE